MADLSVAATVSRRGLDVEFGVDTGEVVAVLGPNGAGKSTVASVVAGLLRPDRATVRVGQRTLTDTARGVQVPVHRRRVGLLMQDPLLFPHLSVRGNVMFAAGRGEQGRARAQRWLDLFGVSDLADRRPAALSGGEAQRTALARALAAEPDVLVLDEPLAGLDVAAAASVRGALREVVGGGVGGGDGRPVLLVTHDLLDVVGLADRVLVMESGRIVESGAVAEVLAAPRSAFGARIAGVNLVRGVIDAAGSLVGDGHAWHGLAGEPLAAGADGVAVFSPASVAVFRDRPHGSPRNSVPVRVAGLEMAGSVVRVRAAGQPGGPPGLAADITPEAVAELGLSVGMTVWFTVKTQEVGLHAASRHGSA